MAACFNNWEREKNLAKFHTRWHLAIIEGENKGKHLDRPLQTFIFTWIILLKTLVKSIQLHICNVKITAVV